MLTAMKFRYIVRIVESLFIFGIAVLTLAFQYFETIPLPLLAIPFVAIISMRFVFAGMEDAKDI